MKRHFVGYAIIALVSVLAIAQGCGVSNGVVGGACKEGLSACAQSCFDISTNNAHCGGCNNSCPSGVQCIQGTCGGPIDATSDTNFDANLNDASDASGGDSGDSQVSGDANEAGPLCEPPYDTNQNCGSCGTVCKASEDCLLGGAATLGCRPKCAAPKVACAGRCVDLQNDPSNCGSCGKFCTSFLCSAGECQGSNPGDISILGHDFETISPNTSQAVLLANAVFIPRSNPLRILSYEEFASPVAVANVKAVVRAGAGGRTIRFTVSGNAADLASPTLIANYDVIVIYDQGAGTAVDLTARGTQWRTALSRFAIKGGAVVALDGAAGNGAMPELLTAAGLLNVQAHVSLSDLFPVVITDQASILASGVVSPYAAFAHSVEFTTSERPSATTQWVVRSGLSGTGEPVVVHKIAR
jgi:hypothetical protein